MGQVRLGRLPKRWGWPQVFEGKGSTLTAEPAAVAAGIATVAAKDLDQLREQPDVIGFRVWLIVRRPRLWQRLELSLSAASP